MNQTKAYHRNQANIHKSRARHHHRRAVASVMGMFVGLFMLASTYNVLFAAGIRKIAVVETEQGTRTDGATIVDDAAAAGKKYIRFAPVAGVPTTSAPGTPSPQTNKVRRFPGDPNPKLYSKAYWGSSIGGNGDPTRHESPTGVSLSVRRTFWQWADADGGAADKMFVSVKDDLSKNRLPMISIKTPGWKAVADGTYDTVLDNMLKQLDSYGKPVWFSVHHEPEGGGGSNTPDDPGGAAEWRRMQSKVRARMKAVGTKNIAFMPILMSYTWNTASGRTPNDWWVEGVWDAYCVDHYRDNTSGDMFTAQWTPFVQWAEAKKIPVCVGEWGNRGSDAQAAKEMQAFWDWTFANKKDVVAYAYFDSGLNSPNGSWELVGEPLNTFRNILKTDTKVQRINDL